MIVRDRGHRQQSSPVLKSEISWISTLQGLVQAGLRDLQCITLCLVHTDNRTVGGLTYCAYEVLTLGILQYYSYALWIPVQETHHDHAGGTIAG